MLPTKRTFIKTMRGLGFAAAAAVLVYLTDHAADLNIKPEYAPLYGTFIAFAYRWVRDAQGKGPTS